MPALEYYSKPILLLAPALTKGHGDSIHPTALLVVRGRRPSLVAELFTPGTQG